MEVKGKIAEIFQTQQVTDTFKKREFVLEFAENPQYPEFVKFEMIQDKCGLLDNYQVGNEITISFNLKGRKWNDPKGGVKYFNTLQAWRIQSGASQTQTSTPAPQEGMDQMEEPGWINEDEKTDDLPF
ncbi:MAG: DUF3127 domain-containing protein [Cyclobacteriaceae bacterium]|nr:DUF3127 domain-containing protein [Cyclobacteriaceae bacterium]